jgi:hypothetical protein
MNCVTPRLVIGATLFMEPAISFMEKETTREEYHSSGENIITRNLRLLPNSTFAPICLLFQLHVSLTILQNFITVIEHILHICINSCNAKQSKLCHK